MIKMNSEAKKAGEVSFKLDSIPTGTYVIVAFQDVIKNQKEDDYLNNRPRWDIIKFNLEKNIGGIKIQL